MMTGDSSASPESSTSLLRAVPENFTERPLLEMLASVSSRRIIDGAMVLYRTCRANQGVENRVPSRHNNTMTIT